MVYSLDGMRFLSIGAAEVVIMWKSRCLRAVTAVFENELLNPPRSAEYADEPPGDAVNMPIF
jgi:hypothetical protein